MTKQLSILITYILILFEGPTPNPNKQSKLLRGTDNTHVKKPSFVWRNWDIFTEANHGAQT